MKKEETEEKCTYNQVGVSVLIKVFHWLECRDSNYAKKKYAIQEATKAITSKIVIVCSVFSAPRRSNLPKSLAPGMIEIPVPFD